MSHSISDAGYLPAMVPSDKDKTDKRSERREAAKQARADARKARADARKSRSQARKARVDARRGARDETNTNEEPGNVYTIDELAAHTNVPSRTIRFYQAQKILDRPKRKGRVAVYTDDHVARLEIIARLQDRGLRIRGMKQLLARGDSDAAVNEWLGLEAKLSTPWTEDRAKVVDDAQMKALIGERPAGTLAAIVRAGLAERPDDAPGTYFIPSPGLLDAALRLLDAGLGIEVLTQLEPIVRGGLRDTAESVVDYFVKSRGLGEPGSEEQLTAALEALRSVGANAINIIFAQEIERTLNGLLENGPPGKGRGKSKPKSRTRGRRARRQRRRS